MYCGIHGKQEWRDGLKVPDSYHVLKEIMKSELTNLGYKGYDIWWTTYRQCMQYITIEGYGWSKKTNNARVLIVWSSERFQDFWGAVMSSEHEYDSLTHCKFLSLSLSSSFSSFFSSFFSSYFSFSTHEWMAKCVFHALPLHIHEEGEDEKQVNKKMYCSVWGIRNGTFRTFISISYFCVVFFFCGTQFRCFRHPHSWSISDHFDWC